MFFFIHYVSVPILLWIDDSLENIRAFLLQQEGGIEYFKSINTLEKFIKEKKKSLMKQITLENFFNK